MTKLIKPSSNYEYFIKTDTSKYAGEWIAIAQKKIVAHGKDAQIVYQKAQKKAPRQQVSLAKIPQEQMLVLRICL